MRDRGEAVRAHYRAEGATAERERIIELLEANLFSDKGLGNILLSDLIALIYGERAAHLENLRRLADETGEYDSFYNPLIEGGNK